MSNGEPGVSELALARCRSDAHASPLELCSSRSSHPFAIFVNPARRHASAVPARIEVSSKSQWWNQTLVELSIPTFWTVSVRMSFNLFHSKSSSEPPIDKRHQIWKESRTLKKENHHNPNTRHSASGFYFESYSDLCFSNLWLERLKRVLSNAVHYFTGEYPIRHTLSRTSRQSLTLSKSTGGAVVVLPIVNVVNDPPFTMILLLMVVLFNLHRPNCEQSP